MGTWTVTTTDSQDSAIEYSYTQSQKPLSSMGPPPPQETIQQFFQRMTISQVVDPMVKTFTASENAELIKAIGSIPPENRETALLEIEDVITDSGGVV